MAIRRHQPRAERSASTETENWASSKWQWFRLPVQCIIRPDDSKKSGERREITPVSVSERYYAGVIRC
jgi:hypothetical protein